MLIIFSFVPNKSFFAIKINFIVCRGRRRHHHFSQCVPIVVSSERKTKKKCPKKRTSLRWHFSTRPIVRREIEDKRWRQTKHRETRTFVCKWIFKWPLKLFICAYEAGKMEKETEFIWFSLLIFHSVSMTRFILCTQDSRVTQRKDKRKTMRQEDQMMMILQ